MHPHLNHATARGGLTYPGDAYALLGTLGILTARLPQLLQQITDYLATTAAAGRLRETPDGPCGGDAGAAVIAAADALSRAADDATVLRAALGSAQSAIASVEYTTTETGA